MGSIFADKPFRDLLFSQDLLDNTDGFLAGEFSRFAEEEVF